MDKGHSKKDKLTVKTGVNMSNTKKTERVIILIIMALTIFSISVWALLQSLSYLKETDVPKNLDTLTLSIDIDKLGTDILSKVQFETKLEQIDETVARSLLEVSDNSTLKLYMGGGNYSDQLILISSSDNKEALSDQTALEQYLSDAKKSFDTYLPEQAKKISDTVLIKSGCYTVACVTNDIDNAEKVIKNSFKKNTNSEIKTNTEPDVINSTASSIEVSKNTDKQMKYKKIYSDEEVISYPSDVIIIGDTAYEQYDYIENIAVKYTDTINNIADALKEKSDIYSIIVPTSIGITLPDNKKNEANSSNQKKALEKIISNISSDINVVPLYNKLMQHRKEYIYFRTDHHWTCKGAYYAYSEFCKSKQITPNKMKDYKKVSFGSFMGSFYKETEQSESLKKDQFYVYYPFSNKDLTLEYTNSDGVTVKGNVIEDASNYGESLKYSAFIDGDNPLTIIENNVIQDNTSCIVIKESFGNSFIPYLTDHYKKIYVIDYRYWNGNLVDFIDENPVDDVIIINNISMTRNSYQVGKMSLLVEDSNGI